MKFFFFAAFIGALVMGFITTNADFLTSPNNNNTILNGSTDLKTASISGKINIPSTQVNTSRRFRSSYGSRTNRSSNSNGQNQYLSTVVSAHPLNFEAPDMEPEDSILIRQKDAEFIPSITPVKVGSTVYFVNDDPFYHNVFSLTPGAKFNIGRRPTGDIFSKEIPVTKWRVEGLGPISIFCDIHSQMNAVILSLDTPFYSKLNEDGSFELKGLPAGEYEIRVYNKAFDLLTQQITVKTGQTYSVEYNLN